MKHRIVSLTFVFGLVISLIASTMVFVPKASAEVRPGDGSRVEVTLNGTKSSTSYSVKSSYKLNGKSTPISFQKTGSNVYLSDRLSGTGGDCNGPTSGSAQSLKTANQFTVAVFVGSKQVGSTVVDLCGKGTTNTYLTSIKVTDVAQAQRPASFCGGVSYKSDDGDKIKPVGEEATGTLKGGPQDKSYALKFNDKGQITNCEQLKNLAPGEYSVTVDYIPPKSTDGTSNRHFFQRVTLGEGRAFVLDKDDAVAGKATAADLAEEADDEDDSTPGLTCDVKFFNPLTWLMCPLVKGMVNIVGQLDNLITSQLSVGSPGNSDDPNQIFCSSDSKATLKDDGGNLVRSCAKYHDAWKSFRNIALGLMVLAGLVIIIAQMMGSEIIDAYTVRKVLPRLIIAAIAITLSWQLMRFFVTLTNDLGYGIRFLIYQPFAGLSDASLGGGGQTAVGLVGGGAIVALGIFGVASFAVTAALAVSIALLVLIIRQLLIIVLVIMAPIAIVAYILPNTQNMFKIWWDSFSKALMMFPLIAAFIAIGHVFSLVSTANSGNSIGQLVGFVAYFAPYFLLPLTFKFAGGALRQIGGFMNDRGRGGFDRLRNFRGNQAKKNMLSMQENRRFNPNRKGALGAINKRANSFLSSAVDPVNAAKIYGGSALRKAGVSTSLGGGVLGQINQGRMTSSQKLGEKMNAMGFNDRALRKLMELDDFSAGNIRNKATEMLASSNSNDRLAGRQLMDQGAYLAQSVYSDPELGRADIGLAAGLAVTAQGFSDSNEIAALANKDRLQGVSAAAVTQMQLNGQRGGRLDMKAGYGVQTGADGKFVGMAAPDAEAFSKMSSAEQNRVEAHQVKRLLTMSQQDLQGAKAGSVSAMGVGFKKILETDAFDDQGKATFNYVNEQGQAEEYKIDRLDVQRVAAMMGTAVTDYAGTSPDTARTIKDLISSSNMGAEAQGAYQASTARNYDPERNNEGATPPPDQGADQPH